MYKQYIVYLHIGVVSKGRVIGTGVCRGQIKGADMGTAVGIGGLEQTVLLRLIQTHTRRCTLRLYYFWIATRHFLSRWV